MFYIFLLLILVICSIYEVVNRLTNSKIYYFLLVLLTLVLCFRYMQGTDYPSYYRMYKLLSPNAGFWVNVLYHGEIGWQDTMILAKRIGLDFFEFIICLSIIEMFLIHRFISDFSPYRITSLLLLYPTYYLTYLSSALRQGLVLSIFLGISVPLLLKKKYCWYIVSVLLETSFHSASIVLLLLPVAIRFVDFDKSSMLFVFSMVLSVILFVLALLGLLGGHYSIGVSVLGILIRVIFFYMIMELYKPIKNSAFDSIAVPLMIEKEDILYRMYLIGFLISIILMFSDLLSQRLTMPIKAIEISLFPLLLNMVSSSGEEKAKGVSYLLIRGNREKNSIPIFYFIVVAIVCVETIKNLNSYLIQGRYYDWVTIWSYPYSNIFDKSLINNFRRYY